MDLIKRVCFVFFALSSSFVANSKTEEEFIKHLISLDFNQAYLEADALDELTENNYYRCLTQIFYNAGQIDSADSISLNTLSKNYKKGDSYVDLIEGVYHLFNNKSQNRAYEKLVQTIFSAKSEGNKNLLKIAYFSILELYSREIIQSSEDYLKYLTEFKKLIDGPEERAWYLIHYTIYLTKLYNLEDPSIYRDAYDDLKNHFENNIWTKNLKTHFLFHQGIYLRFTSDINGAKSSFYEAISVSENHPFLNNIKFSSYLVLSHLESIEGNYTRAKYYLDRTNEFWDKSDSLRSKFIYDRFAAYYYYEKIGDFDSAYKYLRRSNDIEPELDFRKNTLKISEMNVKLRTAEKENEILAQKNKLAVQQQWLLTITIFSIILAGLLLALVLTFRKIKTKNRKIQTLMRELHHRVKNNLQVVSSLLGLQSMKLQDPVARKAVTEGKDRLRAMSLIHQKLYQDEDKIGLNIKEYLSNLVTELAQSYGYQNKTKFILDIPSIELDADNTLPLGLIVNELASNSFKYAFHDIPNPELEVKLFQENEKEFSFLFRDNGPGFSNNFDITKSNSFGTKLVSILVKQLNGTMEINYENGLTYRINFRFR